MKKIETYEEYEDEHDDVEEESTIVSVFDFISTWFIRIGIVIAVILILIFLFSGKMLTALFYVIVLIGAFLLGYGFMFLLDFFVSD